MYPVLWVNIASDNCALSIVKRLRQPALTNLKHTSYIIHSHVIIIMTIVSLFSFITFAFNENTPELRKDTIIGVTDVLWHFSICYASLFLTTSRVDSQRFLEVIYMFYCKLIFTWRSCIFLFLCIYPHLHIILVNIYFWNVTCLSNGLFQGNYFLSGTLPLTWNNFNSSTDT